MLKYYTNGVKSEIRSVSVGNHTTNTYKLKKIIGRNDNISLYLESNFQMKKTIYSTQQIV